MHQAVEESLKPTSRRGWCLLPGQRREEEVPKVPLQRGVDAGDHKVQNETEHKVKDKQAAKESSRQEKELPQWVLRGDIHFLTNGPGGELQRLPLHETAVP